MNISKLFFLLIATPSFIYARGDANGLLADAIAGDLHIQYVDLAAQAQAAITQGADINHRDEESFTPLHNAVLSGNRDLVNVLLAHRANITSRNFLGETPLSITRQANYRDPVITQMMNTHIRTLAHPAIAQQMTALACMNHGRLGQGTAGRSQCPQQTVEQMMREINNLLHRDAELNPERYQIR